jgi:hypothetical protein
MKYGSFNLKPSGHFQGCTGVALSAHFSSYNEGDPHRSGFKIQTAVLSVLCVMFHLQLSVVDLLNVDWQGFQFFQFLLPLRWLQLLPVLSHIS